MFMQIISHTPTWVFVLFFALVALGLRQTRSRKASVQRQVGMPLAFTSLSLYGVISAFHGGLLSLTVWLIGSAIVAGFMLRRPLPEGTHYDAGAWQFNLPGSWVPFFIIMGIFSTKYTVGVMLGIHPELASQTDFALYVSGLYGALSGVFLGRSLRLIRLMRTSAPSSQASTNAS
jgi:hypothetical protein